MILRFDVKGLSARKADKFPYIYIIVQNLAFVKLFSKKYKFRRSILNVSDI